MNPATEAIEARRREIVCAATVEATAQIADVIQATISQLQSIHQQLGLGSGSPNVLARKHGRDLAEMLVESIQTDSPVCPTDLVLALDPEDELIDSESAIDAVECAITSVLKGMRYE